MRFDGSLSKKKRNLPRDAWSVGQPYFSTLASRVMPALRISSGMMSFSRGRTARISLSTFRIRGKVKFVASSSLEPPNIAAKLSVLSSRSKVSGRWFG